MISKISPKILRHAQMDKGQFQRRRPVGDQTLNRDPSANEVAQRSQDSTVEKPECGVIPLMLADRGMVDIVRQANDEPVPQRNRWNLNQGNSAPRDDVSQQRDVELKRRQTGIRGWLTGRQQGANLSKQTIADSGPRPFDGGV